MRATALRGRIEITENRASGYIPPGVMVYPKALIYRSPDHKKIEEQREGQPVKRRHGFEINLEQWQPVDYVDDQGGDRVFKGQPNLVCAGIYVGSTARSDEGTMEVVTDIDQLEDVAVALVATIAQARARGLFPSRRRQKADSRGIEITEKGRAALAAAKGRKRGRGQ